MHAALAMILWLAVLLCGLGWAPVQAAVVSSVQSGTTTLSSNSSSVTAAITSVNTSKAFLVFSLRINDNDPQYSQISGQLTNGTTITFRRDSSFGSPSATIEWFVVEFASGVSVQRGSATMSSTTVNQGIASIDTGKSFPLISYRNSGTIYGNDDFIRGRLTSATNLELSAYGSNASGIVEWQVVEFTGATVQSGDLAFGTTQSSKTATITSVDTGKSWLIYNYKSDNGTSSDIGQKLVRGLVTNATTLTFDRNRTGQAIDLSWFLVEFTDGTTVQRGNQNMGTGTTQSNVAITSVDTSKSFATGGYFGRGGRSSYSSDDNPGVGWATFDLTSSTNLQITRALTGSSTADFGWFVTTFASDSIAPATVSNLATGTVTDESIQLTWTAPGDDNTTGTATTYDIRYRTDAPITGANWDSATQVSGEPAPSAAGSAESFTVTGLTGGTQYYFALKTADEVPNWSGVSNSPTASTLSDGTAPAAVTNLAAGTVTQTTALLTWTAPGDDNNTGTATSYDIRYRTDAPVTEANWASATQVSGEPAPAPAGRSESMRLTGLSTGTTYYFAIKTADEIPNISAVSNSPGATTHVTDQTAPDAVIDLAAGSATTSSIQLSWTAPGDDYAMGTATSYDIRYRTGGPITAANWAAATQASGEPAPGAAGSAGSFTVTGLSVNTTYYFAIKTADEVPNTSALSNNAVATTLASGSSRNYKTRSSSGISVATGISTSMSCTDYSSARITLMDTSYNCNRARIELNNIGTFYDMYYNTAYASSTTITGGNYYIFLEDKASGGGTISAQLFWVSSGGSQTFFGSPATASVCSGCSGDRTLDLSGQSGAIPAGGKLGLRVRYSSGSSNQLRIETGSDRGTYGGTLTFSEAVASDTTAPAAVSSLATGSTTATSVALSWTAPGDDGSSGTASTYDIRYSTSPITVDNWASATQASGEPFPKVAGSGESFTVTGLQEQTTYYFAIRTSDEVPNTSALSNVASATTPSSDSTPPATISNLAAINPTSSTVSLTWTAPGDDGSTGTATTYDIRYATSPITAGNWGSATQVEGEPGPSVAGSAESFTVTDLDGGTTYYFAIKTADEKPNWSGLSNSPGATTTGDGIAPAAVSNLAAGNATNTTIRLTWTAPGDDNNTGTATTYDIRYRTGGAINDANWASATQVNGEPSPSVAGSAESFTVTGLSPGTTYWFAIKTADETPRWSLISNSPSLATTNADQTAPAAVVDLSGSALSTTSIQVSWTAPGNDGNSGTAASYDLRYSTGVITEGNWASATQVAGEPAPSVAGTGQSMNVTGLTSNTTYYFALKTADAVPNTSAISNIAVATTNGGSSGSATYYWNSSNGTSVATGITTDWGSCGAQPSSTRKTLMVTSAFNCSDDRHERSSNGTFFDMYFNTAYAQDTLVTGSSFKVQGDDNNSGGFTVSAQLFHVSPGGTQTFIGTAATANVSSGSTTNLTINISGQSATVPAGNKLGLRVATPSGSSSARRVRLGSGISSGFGGTLAVTEATSDSTAPNSVTLSTSTITNTSVRLTWTAPGDDGATGTAKTYDLRYRTDGAINAGNWATATQVSGEPAPQAAGSSESFTVTGLAPGTAYWFALKTADEVPNWSALSNSPGATTTTAPVGGYTADNVIPTAQVAQATTGTGVITITWKGRDAESNNVTLNSFQYSVDGGTTWQAPGNDDASAAFSANWSNNGGAGYATATTLGAAAAHSFTLNTKHGTLSGLAGLDQSSVRVRFRLNDGSSDSGWLTSQNFRVDNSAPTATITSSSYNADTDTLTITGTNFTTIAAASTDIKSQVDWTRIKWDINGDNATSGFISIALGDVTSFTVTGNTTLTLVFTGAKGTAIEAAAGYGTAGGADTLDVTAGFLKDAFGNAAATDAVSNAPLLVNDPPVGGYTADNVIGAAQISQLTDGSGDLLINWKGRDNQADNVTLNTFQYSVDGGATWNAPTNGDASAALSADWKDDGGPGWTTAATLADATAHSFRFHTKHADVTGLNGVDQSDVRVRFKLYDGARHSVSYVTSADVRVDDAAPSATIISAIYNAVTNAMTLTGTNFTTIAAVDTDIKSYVDWSRFVWDINGDDATSADISVALGDVSSLTIIDDTTLILEFTEAKGEEMELTAGYSVTGGNDTLDVTAGFIRDDFGNASTTDGVSNAPLTTQDPPIGGYTDDNILPAAQITQAADGTGVITITWKGRDNQANNVTLNTFEYSVDNGDTWSAPASNDASGAFSANWTNNGGGGWTTATTFAAATAHSFTFNTRHADVTGLAGVDQDDVMLRFLLNDGSYDSGYVTSNAFRVDNLTPTATLASASYNAATDTLTVTGANFTTIAAAATDIKGYVDWSRFVWDINGDNAATANVTFALGDITSLTVTSDTTLTLVLAPAKATALEGTTGFGGVNEADTLDVSAGFSRDVFGNAATTDGVADAPLNTGPVTYTVTKTSDTHDGSCDLADCSLREAISAANANIGADTISVPAGTYTLTRTGGADNTNASGDLDITESVTITGAGMTSTLIDGNAGVLNERILNTIAGAADVTLTDLTLQNANAGSGTGAGIYHQGASLTLTRVAIKNNTTTGHGAGISSVIANTLNLNDVEISGNSSTAGNGGGIYAIGPNVTWIGGTASGNSAGAGGAVRYSTGSFSATNVTFSGNAATSSGPAITVSSGTVTLTNVTITNNTGFPAVRRDGGTVTISSSILASNPAGNCFGAITSGGYNLESTTDTCDFVDASDQVNVTAGNLNLGALASNGGSTQTHALLAGSFAIDKIPNGTNGCGTTLTADQRGTARPQSGSCDIGAYEYVVPPNTAPLGGHTADNVIPAGQVTQSSNGDGIVTINFRAKDAETNNVTLKTFQYSVDGGSTWNAPTNADASGALSANWANNGGGGYASAADWSGTVHSFTFNTRHADVSGMAGVDQSDVQVRFTLNDGSMDSTAPVTSENFRVDNVAPTATISSAQYAPASDTLTITGTNFTTIATATTDIKGYVDWSRFVWDINGDDATTANVTFVLGDITSLTVTSDTTLTLVFTGAKATAIEGNANYGATGGADTLDVTAGFSRDAFGNAATSDAVANGTLVTPELPDLTVCASGCDHFTIQAAINASSNGDRILVRDGTYSENINFNNKLVTVVSENGAATTKIQGASGGNNAVASFTSGETASAVLDGFTIDNQGSGARYRGIRITNNSTPTIQNCIIEGNVLTTITSSADNWGGGIYIDTGGGATIDNTIIGRNGTANQANRGSGIYASGGSSISISNSTISYNSGRDVGGIYLLNMTGTTTLTNTSVTHNNANGYIVGGVYANASSISITGGSISNNTGTFGAGLRLENVPTITTINGVAINGNTSSGQPAGGIYSIDSPMAISNGTTVNNNSSRDGAGIYLTGSYSSFPADTKTTIDGSTISGNNANGYLGGGIFSNGSPLAISNSNITLNNGRQGAGLRLLNLPLVTVITNTNIDDNLSNSSINGGGVYSLSSPLTISGGSISRNTGIREGAGIYLDGNYSAYPPGTKTSVTGTAINNNDSGSYTGGGIYSNAIPIDLTGVTVNSNSAATGAAIKLVNLTAVAVLDNVTVSNNTATSGTSSGGAIVSSEAPMDIRNNSVISGNTAGRQGAALFVTGAYAAFAPGTVTSITGSTVSGNISSQNYVGGGVYTTSPMTIVRSRILGNRGGNGGGLYSNTTLSITNSIFAGNVADRGTNDGGALNVTGSATITNSTIAGNYASRYAGGLQGAATVVNSIIWGNTSGSAPAQVNGGPTITYSDVQGGHAGTGNINGDPLFVNLQQAGSGSPTTAGDFHICNAAGVPAGCGSGPSPAIDAGTASGAPADDIDGDSRYQGSGYDMGADEYPAGAPINTAPLGGHTADNVIPAGQVSQSSSGDGLITINFRARDAETNNVTLKTFQYSVDGGSTWNAPTNADASGSLSANWANNGGGGYASAADWSGTVHSFTFNTRHADVSGMAGVDQADVQVRFTLNDGSVDSAAPAASENFRVDNVAPTATITSASYNAATDTLTITGTNFTTIATAATDIKAYADWSRFVWDINGDDATTANVTFVQGDITSLTVSSDTTLTLVFTGAKGTAIEATAGYGGVGGADTLDVTAGFIRDAFGNAATTDGVADGPIGVPGTIAGTVYTDEGATNIGSGKTVRLLVNGASAGTGSTNASGQYSISAVANAGDALLVYIDDDATYKGTTATVTSGANLAGLNIFAGHVITRHDHAGALSNANLSTALGAYADTDILYSVSGGNLAVSGSGTELYVPTGHTFTPAGNVSTMDVKIIGTLNGGANTFTVAGNWNSTGGTVAYGSGTLRMTGVSKTFQTKAAERPWNLTIGDGVNPASVTHAAASWQLVVGNNLVLSDNATLNVSGVYYYLPATGAITIGTGATLDITGVLTRYIDDSSSHVSTAGTISGTGTFQYDIVGGSASAPVTARTYGVHLSVSGAADAVGVLGGGASLDLGAKNLLIYDANSNNNSYSLLDNPGNIPVTAAELFVANPSGSGNGPSFTGKLVCRGATYTFTHVTVYSSVTATPTIDCATGGESSTWNVSGNVTIDGSRTYQGDLAAGASAWNVGGNWSNSGAFTAGSSTVTLNGADQSISGNTTFNNLAKSVATARTLTFTAGSTTTVNGAATLKGVAGQLLSLRSSGAGTRWNLVLGASAAKDIDFVDVKDSDASGSDAALIPIRPANYTDSGNTVSWFGEAVITVTKLSSIVSDPINGTTNPKRIPGAVVEYSVMPSNTGDASPDANSVVVTDVVDSGNVGFDVATGVSFTDGATSSGLALGTTTYSSTAAPGPYVYDYTPAPDGDGYDDNITSIRITTTGAFAYGGTPAPGFTLKYRVKVR